MYDLCRTADAPLADMAPEMIRSTGVYDGKQTDVWSCGIMLYVRGIWGGMGPGELAAWEGKQVNVWSCGNAGHHALYVRGMRGIPGWGGTGGR